MRPTWLTSTSSASTPVIWVGAAGLAIAWTLAKGEHVLPIPGTRHKEHLAQCVQAMNTALSPDQVEEIERILPVGFAHGDRYSDAQYKGQERYC